VRDGEAVRRIGVISLPTFYQDFEARKKGDQNFKSATRDVARLLGELKKEKVDGVLVDLRNNGGGSLMEAVELTGLFIDKGPVVQQRNAQGEIAVESDNQPGAAWDGPLGVLINRASASASEIFAAAIQDYGRGLLIGETSFGKGTVQAMINLDQIAKNDKKIFGDLKLTIAQFFRVNGGTTQLRGVQPDIRFPAFPDADNLGESSFDNALPWEQVKAATYSPAGDYKYLKPLLLARHEARVKKNQDFVFLQEDIAEFKFQRKKNQVSLNEAERRQERDAQEARLASREARKNAGKSAQESVAGQESASVNSPARRDDGLQADERTLASELEVEKARKNAKDVFLNEAAHILSDEVGLLKNSARLAARSLPAIRSKSDQQHSAEAVRSGVW
jgi:carboxyl-terminal processing protease